MYEEDEPGTKVFVGNISDSVEVETIRNEFQKFGHVNDIAFDIASAYITYDRHNEAQNAVSKMNGKELMGEKLKVEIYNDNLTSDRQTKSSYRSANEYARRSEPPQSSTSIDERTNTNQAFYDEDRNSNTHERRSRQDECYRIPDRFRENSRSYDDEEHSSGSYSRGGGSSHGSSGFRGRPREYFGEFRGRGDRRSSARGDFRGVNRGSNNSRGRYNSNNHGSSRGYRGDRGSFRGRSSFRGDEDHRRHVLRGRQDNSHENRERFIQSRTSVGDIRNEDYSNQRYTNSNNRDESRYERTRSIRGTRSPFRGRFRENRGGFRSRGDRGSTRGSFRGDYRGSRLDQGSSSNTDREMNHGSSTREDSGATSNYRNEFENERVRENQYNHSRDRDYRSERLQQHEQQSNNRSSTANYNDEPRNDRNDHRSHIREGDIDSFRGPPDGQGNRDRFIRSIGDRNDDVRYSNEQRDSSHRMTTSRDEFREPSRRSIRGSRLFRGRGGLQPQRGGHYEQESQPRSYRSRSPIMDDRRESSNSSRRYESHRNYGDIRMDRNY